MNDRELGEHAVEGEGWPPILPVERERPLGVDGVSQVEVLAVLIGDRQKHLEDVRLGDALVAAEADDTRAVRKRAGAHREDINHLVTLPFVTWSPARDRFQ